jgi:hypothetical protein
MLVMTVLVEYQDPDAPVDLILGRCEHCDFDATWEVDENNNEKNLKRFFFG